jgi:hypothetical protein
VIFKPEIVEEAEATVHHIQENLKAMKSRQEIYANKRCQSLEFEVGDHVYLRVWGERKVSASLYPTIPHPREMWDYGLQA